MSPLAYVVAFGIGLLVGLVGLVVVVTYQSVVTLERQVDAAWANLAAVLEERSDLLGALVATVDRSIPDDRETVERASALHAAHDSDAPIPVQAETSEATTAALGRLLTAIEAHPALRADRELARLRHELERLESVLAGRRDLYDHTVERFDTRIQTFPATVLAPFFRWRERQPFRSGAGTSVAAGRPSADDPSAR